MRDYRGTPSESLLSWYRRLLSNVSPEGRYPLRGRDPRGKRKEPAKGVQKRSRRGNRRKHRKG